MVAATVAIVTYLSAFGFSVYDRIPISDWLTRHLPLATLKKRTSELPTRLRLGTRTPRVKSTRSLRG